MKSVRFGKVTIYEDVLAQQNDWSSRDQSWWTRAELGMGLDEEVAEAMLGSVEVEMRGLEPFQETSADKKKMRAYVKEVVQKHKKLTKTAKKLGSKLFVAEPQLQRFCVKATKEYTLKAKNMAQEDQEAAGKVYLDCLDQIAALMEGRPVESSKSVVDSRCEVVNTDTTEARFHNQCISC